MPALPNSRHERFAQELAKGKSQSDAYTEAGYRPSRSAAARLAGDVHICERVREIAERAAIRTEITVASITDRLLKIAEKAEGKDEAALLNVARASLMDAAKLNGLVIDKAETALIDKRAAEMTEEELLAIASGSGPGATSETSGPH